ERPPRDRDLGLGGLESDAEETARTPVRGARAIACGEDERQHLSFVRPWSARDSIDLLVGGLPATDLHASTPAVLGPTHREYLAQGNERMLRCRCLRDEAIELCHRQLLQSWCH